jgi:hypothetical protein
VRLFERFRTKCALHHRFGNEIRAKFKNAIFACAYFGSLVLGDSQDLNLIEHESKTVKCLKLQKILRL